MAAYGLYTHIQANKRRSIALLIWLFGLVYVLIYAGALAGEALSYDASIDWYLRRAWQDLLAAAPFATVGAAIWIVIAYYFHQSMIDAVTGGHEVTRTEQPRLYNLLENLCISRGIPMPKLKLMESSALNAFATGMNQKQYSITVTTGLLAALDDQEIEAVLGHELTHIRNGDVRMLVTAVIIAGVVSFAAELMFRLWFWGGLRFRGRGGDSSGRGRGDFGVAILIAVVLIVVAWVLGRSRRKRVAGFPRRIRQPRHPVHGDRGRTVEAVSLNYRASGASLARIARSPAKIDLDQTKFPT